MPPPPPIGRGERPRHGLLDCRAVYKIDRRDKVIPLDSLPQSATGAPLPCLVADEDSLRIAYISHEGSDGDTIVTVTFEDPYAHMFGPPNDEAFSGHPLADRGLEPYGAFRIDNSSWVRRLERMNAVHPGHSPESFEALIHYVLSFHDSTFECVAGGMHYESVGATRAFALTVQMHP